MKHIFQVGASIVVSLAFGLLTYTGSIIYETRGADTDSQKFANMFILEIINERNPLHLMSLSTPNAWSSQTYHAVYSRISTFGKLLSYTEPTGESSIPLFSLSNSAISASYQADAIFEKGAFHFEVGLLLVNNRWMVNSLYIKAKPEQKVRDNPV